MNKRRDDEPSAIFSRRGQARPVSRGPAPRGPSGRGPRDYTVPEEEDDFTPPNPKNPLAGAKPGVVLGWFLVIAAILALVIFPFLPVSFPSWTTPALIGAAVLGLIILFLQMPSKRPTTGDGAQV
ncbi:hypothetical protein [Nesterenkonia alba]|uniref:hypothetical protein n=1 Tax=Nesterenkonia alba TaxID=515814 RepID=UPI0003B3D8DA|nr:hypothetical protein [Nesterenkonia alba]